MSQLVHMLCEWEHCKVANPPHDVCRAATGEVADVALEYLPPDRLGLARGDLPRSAWPPPRRHLWPFGASA